MMTISLKKVNLHDFQELAVGHKNLILLSQIAQKVRVRTKLEVYTSETFLAININ
jgi:hypothetical protein